jgi:hypothetical protein
MPIQTFRCPVCRKEVEKIVKNNEVVYCPECYEKSFGDALLVEMKQIWSVPSPLQWGPGVRNF